MAIIRSTDPNMARCMITGRFFSSPSSPLSTRNNSSERREATLNGRYVINLGYLSFICTGMHINLGYLSFICTGMHIKIHHTRGKLDHLNAATSLHYSFLLNNIYTYVSEICIKGCTKIPSLFSPFPPYLM